MKMKQIVEGVYILQLGNVNAYLLKREEGLILIDTGTAGNASNIIQAIESIGYKPSDLKMILLTHCHPDHAGSAAALKLQIPDVSICIHELDAPFVEQGIKMRPMKAAPGLLNKLFFRLFVKDTPIEPVAIDRYLKADNYAADEIYVIHVPGHSLGQVAFLLPEHGGVLIAADTASNMMGLDWCIGYEDLQAGKESLYRLGQLKFEIACFGHGKPILTNAAQAFRTRWQK